MFIAQCLSTGEAVGAVNAGDRRFCLFSRPLNHEGSGKDGLGGYWRSRGLQVC